LKRRKFAQASPVLTIKKLPFCWKSNS